MTPIRYQILAYVFFVCLQLSAQKNDYNWVMGSHATSTIDMILKDSINKRFWPFTLNFTSDPMTIDYYPYRRFIFDATNTNYSDDRGELVCYTNGMQVFGADDLPLQGGDTINYNNYWSGKVHPSTGDVFGFSQFQGNIMLPMVQDGKELLYDFNQAVDFGSMGSFAVWYAIIERGCNSGKGCVVSKDNVLFKAQIKGFQLQACRHANGRDWWIIVLDSEGVTYYTFLLDPSGVHAIHTQAIGKYNPVLSAGNATFSHAGDKYAVCDGRYWDSIGVVSIFDFDRCTGLLSNPFFDTLVIPEASVGQSVAFSPNDRYLYVNNMNDLYQYDMSDLHKPRIHIATYDGFYDGDNPNFRTSQFGFWGYGPDGRLYNVSGAASAGHLHILDYPDEPGDACSFRQHALRIPNNPWSMPNFPHYRLGPLDGSPCDTLGLDNHPVAKFRYEPDSLDYLRLRFTDLSYFRPESWSWNFGDGSPQESTKSPYHTFPHQGVYHVCLTVSNENSSNTSCRDIALGTSSSTDISARKADITTFPNPVEDYLLVTFGEYVPAHGEISFYDISGRPVMTQRLYYGQNSIDMQSLPSGIYLWHFTDKGVQIREGKVVKR
ncbi:MAG: T9SS type A sorting domain-containing protein [Saprospiraceae bacterium]|nr:T9SS type A sorting domain-containing protein [Saprospiraceae bacterium]MCB9310897.1 T9SS type A sorting domain-containing protein [Lewinellaceae bacterium]